MTLSKEQSEEIKKQLYVQVEKLPPENRTKFKSYIEGLNEEQLEEFLKQNNIQLSKEGSIASSPEKETECIFCSIANEKTESYRLMKNKKALAILEINPLSLGHSMVIPLKHSSIEEIPKLALTLAQKIATRMKKKLKADDAKIETSSIMGHSMINIIPIYKDKPMQKYKASESELKSMQKKLAITNRKKRKPEKKDEKIIIKDLPKISFRIP